MLCKIHRRSSPDLLNLDGIFILLFRISCFLRFETVPKISLFMNKETIPKPANTAAAYPKYVC